MDIIKNNTKMSGLHKQLYELVSYGTLDQIKEFLVDKPVDVMKGSDLRVHNLIFAATSRLGRLRYKNHSNERMDILSIWLFIFKHKDVILNGYDKPTEMWYIRNMYLKILSAILSLISKKYLSAYGGILDEDTPEFNIYMKILEIVLSEGNINDEKTRIIWSAKKKLMTKLYTISNDASLERIICTNYFAEFLIEWENDKSRYYHGIFNSLKKLKLIYKHHKGIVHESKYLLMVMLRQNIEIPNNYLLTLELDRLVGIFSCSDTHERCYSALNKALYVKKIYDILSRKGFDFSKPIIENKTLFKYLCDICHIGRTLEFSNIASEYFDKLVALENVSNLSIIADETDEWSILYKLTEHGANISINCKLNQLKRRLYNYHQNNYEWIADGNFVDNYLNIDDNDDDNNNNNDNKSNLNDSEDDYQFYDFIAENPIIAYANSKNIFFLEGWSMYEILSLHIEFILDIINELSGIKRNIQKAKNPNAYKFLDHMDDLKIILKEFIITYSAADSKYPKNHTKKGLFNLIMHEIKYIGDNKIDKYRLPIKLSRNEVRNCDLVKKIHNFLQEFIISVDFRKGYGYYHHIGKTLTELKIFHKIWKMLDII